MKLVENMQMHLSHSVRLLPAEVGKIVRKWMKSIEKDDFRSSLVAHTVLEDEYRMDLYEMNELRLPVAMEIDVDDESWMRLSEMDESRALEENRNGLSGMKHFDLCVVAQNSLCLHLLLSSGDPQHRSYFFLVAHRYSL